MRHNIEYKIQNSERKAPMKPGGVNVPQFSNKNIIFTKNIIVYRKNIILTQNISFQLPKKVYHVRRAKKHNTGPARTWFLLNIVLYFHTKLIQKFLPDFELRTDGKESIGLCLGRRTKLGRHSIWTVEKKGEDLRLGNTEFNWTLIGPRWSNICKLKPEEKK